LDDALEASREGGNRFVWIGLKEPTMDEIASVAHEFDLHPLAVEDAVHAHQRPKLDRYGETFFMVIKTATYIDSHAVLDIGEVMFFVGAAFVVTVRHGDGCDIAAVRCELEAKPERLARGPSEVVYGVADRIVDEYSSALRHVDDDIDDIQEQVFAGPKATHAARIFRLKREVLAFRQAVIPLADPLHDLSQMDRPLVAEGQSEYFRDVRDHVLRVSDRLMGIDDLLSGALSANVAQVGMRQNEDMRKISAWVAIVAVPTMIAGIYGMNFEHMPELGWQLGYPAALMLMLGSCLLLYRNFKRRGWL
jgi:magnesium transporter